MSDIKHRMVVVSGPTASGKSALAIRLARRFNGEIISADSRQVYHGMDIGTGKVKRDKSTGGRVKGMKVDFYSEGIRHHLLDVASPTRQYSVARFKRDATRAIGDITRRGKLPIIVGGTGFWIDALVYDQSLPAVKPDSKLRKRFGKLSSEHLFKMLRKLDPARAATIDRHNPVRLIRALEIVMTTGEPVSLRTNGSPYEPFYLCVSVPKGVLKRRIERRLDARLKVGMVAEVRRLHANGVSWKRLESFGLEYRWVARFLRSSASSSTRLNLGEMRDGLLRDIIAYSKRQLTWWRRNADITRIASPAEASRRVADWLSL